jgi:menaquinone-dependent protoporphyrinogen oxidase
MSHRTLVAYASRAGSTAEVAEAIGDVLRTGGLDVDIRPVKEVVGVGGYDSLVLGTAIWAGQPLPEMKRFAVDHRAALGRMPVAYFIQCDLLRENTPASRQIALGYVAPLRKVKEPVSVGLFAGRRVFGTANPLVVWVFKRILRLQEGDWRNWDQIRAWAESLVAQLARGETVHVEAGAA